LRRKKKAEGKKKEGKRREKEKKGWGLLRD
jgi:hypothetical protein